MSDFENLTPKSGRSSPRPVDCLLVSSSARTPSGGALACQRWKSKTWRIWGYSQKKKIRSFSSESGIHVLYTLLYIIIHVSSIVIRIINPDLPLVFSPVGSAGAPTSKQAGSTIKRADKLTQSPKTWLKKHSLVEFALKVPNWFPTILVASW